MAFSSLGLHRCCYDHTHGGRGLRNWANAARGWSDDFNIVCSARYTQLKRHWFFVCEMR